VNVGELRQRRELDYRVLRAMENDVFSFDAYATSADLESGQRRITSVAEGGSAAKYVFRFAIRTLVARGAYSDLTTIGVDTDSTDFPRRPPNTWVVGRTIPWSPHFRAGYPVCIGEEMWDSRGGYVLLGHLVIHLARLLNWDEPGRGPGYRGWNGEAIDYHRDVLGGRPLTANVKYPALPAWLYGTENDPVFEPIGTPGTTFAFEPLR
jgi:hypothetical protein